VKLEEAKELYPNEWIAFRVDRDGENPEGEVLMHGSDRDSFERELLERGIINVYVFYSGPIVPEGYTVVFLLRTSV